MKEKQKQKVGLFSTRLKSASCGDECVTVPQPQLITAQKKVLGGFRILNPGGYGKDKAFVPAECQHCHANEPVCGFAPIFDEIDEQSGHVCPILLCYDCWEIY